MKCMGTRIRVVMAIVLVTSFGLTDARAQTIGISADGHRLVKSDGSPFFWMGDTGWGLRKLNDADVAFYLSTRAQQRYNVVQMHLSYTGTDINGNTPYLNNNTDTPNEAYWQRMDAIISQIGTHGLYAALAVMWGNDYDIAFGTDTAKAARLGNWLGQRYRARSNVFWIVSGEYAAVNDYTYITASQKAVFDSLAQGLRNGHGGNILMTIHPTLPNMSSSEDFHIASWLNFNMLQSGHQDDNERWGLPENRTVIRNDYNLSPTKPTLDGEPAYEDTPDGFYIGGGSRSPRMGAEVVRRKAYGAIFAGACCHTYGHNDVYSFFTPGQPTTSAQRNYWKDSMLAPGATQMVHLRNLMEARDFLKLIPDQSIIISNTGSGKGFIQALRANDGTYALVYIPQGNAATINLGALSGGGVQTSWYNPRDGSSTNAGTFSNSGSQSFDAPGATASGNDWVLVLDSVAGPVNQPPSVSIASPAAGQTFRSPASISISVNASDNDGTIARVDIYGDGALLTSDTSSPYTFTWTGVGRGNHTISAIAMDNLGATASTSITIRVRP